jgi:uncharacterized protein (TIGR00255 family)
MTGFGEARLQDERWSVAVEVRTVNNRHLKLTAKISEPYGALETELDRLVRETIRRGTVQLTLRVDRPRRPEDYRLNLVALRSYLDQVRELRIASDVLYSGLLGLPGVVEETRPGPDDPHDDWPALAAVVALALERLQAARREEGRVMAEELRALARAVGENLARIADRGPEVVAAYQKRLTERIQATVQSQGVAVELEPRDLIREVAIFSERADISEEIVRLRAHLGQFAQVIDEPESSGRKLEFVVQEMGREINTVGSKANDVAISQAVVEIKGHLERIRELIQNVE